VPFAGPGSSPIHRRIKNRPNVTQLRIRTVEIRRTQNRGSHSASTVRGQDEISLFFAHAPFECMRIARVSLVDELRLRSAIRIKSAQVNESLHAHRSGGAERDLREFSAKA
jgi:hypothetical protein